MKKGFSKIAALLLLPLPLFGGLSLVLTPGVMSSGVNDPVSGDVSWRVEFQLHDWADPTINTGDAFVWDLNGIGASAAVLTGGVLRIIDKRDSVAPSVCDISLTGRTNILVRVQRDITASRFVCEIWNSDGSGYGESVLSIGSHSSWSASGGRFGSPYTTARLAFFRILPAIVADGSRPPTTATSEATSTSLKFDGDVLDSSGHSHNATFPGSQYVTTPNQNPAALPHTDGAPSWSPWVSVRAGFPAALDGTASFSLADASSTVNYRWQQLAGPTTLRWSDRTSAKPIVKGFIFGTYKVRLSITDAAGKSAVGDLEFGSVATDDNGVVINANPDADRIFGPMIAFGKNPWPWADSMTLHSAQVKKPILDAISPPGWGSNRQGTISYTPGVASQPAQTVLASALAADGTTINVANPTALDLTVLPTVIMLHTPGIWAPIEEVRVCSVQGNVLTPCYDGRAWRRGLYERVGAPQAWPAGTTVRQVKTKGTGTTFVADFCPAGPGEEGQLEYNTGTVTVTPGSNTLTGSGTSWQGSLQGERIRIAGTHSGQPFAFFATVSAVAPTSITMSRPWPGDADPGTGLAYTVLHLGRYIARGWLRPDGTAGRSSAGISSCETDTDMYQTDIFSNIAGAQTAQNFGYQEGSWFSEFGPNYYDEVLAHYAGYLRSGYTLFRDNARKVGDYWTTAPDFDEGWTGVPPRRVGATGMVAGAVLDGRVQNWYTLRRLAGSAIGNPYSGGAILPNCDSDIREGAYGLSWIALAAMFDPVDTGDPNQPNQRSYWKAQLDRAFVRDNNCKGASYEFPQGYWAGGGAYTLTNGSTTVTSTGIPQTLCPVVTTGTINVTNGVVSATGTGFVPSAKIVVMGKRLGNPYLFYTQFSVTSSGAITMSSPYDGDSGTYPYQIESDIYWLAFAKDVSDHETMNKLYACRWIDQGTLELDRPWEGASGTNQVYRYLELGFGQEPFLAGIKVFAMKLASQGAAGATASGYLDLAFKTANWILTKGFDPVVGGLNYARGWPGCEPKLNPRLNCTYGLSPSSMESSRTLNAEAQNAFRVFYEASPTDEARAFGDQFYGSQWGKLGGPYRDNVYLTALDNDNAWSYKWLGFLFGIGMAHQWPAVRIGGVRPAIILTPSVSFNLSSVSGAASARIRVTKPSGAEAVYSCSSSPCQIEVDARQGAHWYRIEYLDSRNAVLSAGEPEIFDVR